MKATRPIQPDPVRVERVIRYLFETQAEARERQRQRHWCYW